MSITKFWLKRASELAAMDYRACKLLIGKHRVNQLTVVGVAAEVVWKEAFHERRGLSNVQLADVASVTLRNVFKMDSVGRCRYLGKVDVALTPADAQMALDVARAVCERIEEDIHDQFPPPPCEINLHSSHTVVKIA